MFRKILLPVDLSDTTFAEHAADVIRGYLDPKEAEVRVLTVRQITPAMAGDFLPPDIEVETQADAEAAVKGIADKVALAPGRTSWVVRVGGVQHEVLEEAKAFGADVIVIGSHKPSIATYLLGSAATEIVRHAKCSVLVVR